MKNTIALIVCMLLAMAVYAQPGSLTTDPEKKETTDLALYPNPATDMIHIEYTRPITEIRIFDIVGQVVGEFKTTGSRNYVIDISELKKGIYFVRIRDDENTLFSQKVMKQ
jgi:hypothetical protein